MKIIFFTGLPRYRSNSVSSNVVCHGPLSGRLSVETGLAIRRGDLDRRASVIDSISTCLLQGIVDGLWDRARCQVGRRVVYIHVSYVAI